MMSEECSVLPVFNISTKLNNQFNAKTKDKNNEDKIGYAQSGYKR